MVHPEPDRESGSLALRLLELAAWVTDALDPDQVLQRVADGLYGVMAAHSAVAYAYHPRERALELRATVGQSPRVRPYVPIRSDGVTTRLLRALGPVAVTDCARDPGVKHELVAAGVRAFVGLPLLRDRTVRAVVYVNFPKPREFPPDLLALLGAFSRQVSVALDRAEAHRALRVTRDRMIVSLAEAVDARDHPTGGHSRRIQALARAIGQGLGLDPDLLDYLDTAALLHDIGKIGVRDAVLLKPGDLSQAERREVEQHSLIGARILAAAGLPEEVVEAVRHAHEWFDGTGYPGRLAGDRIPLLSRIVAVADAFEAMTADRPYRRGTTWENALAELQRQAGTQFDPRVVEALCEILSDPHRRARLAAEISAVSASAGDPTADLHPVEASQLLAKSFYALAWYFIEGFEQTAGPELAERLLDRLPVIPLFEPSASRDGSVSVSHATVLRRLDQYRQQLRDLVDQAQQVCGDRICRNLLHEAVRNLPPELREPSGFLLRGVLPESPSPSNGLGA